MLNSIDEMKRGELLNNLELIKDSSVDKERVVDRRDGRLQG